MRNCRLRIICLLLFLLVIGTRTQAQIAIVVSDSIRVSDVSVRDLRRLYAGSLSTLGGQQVVLLEYTPVAEAFYGTVMRIPLLRFRRHWLKMVFSGLNMPPPYPQHNPQEVSLQLAKNPGAICFLPLDKVTDGMKILTVDHKLPTDTGYPLRMPRLKG